MINQGHYHYNLVLEDVMNRAEEAVVAQIREQFKRELKKLKRKK